MDNLKRNIEFLYEIGSLRYVPRSWRQFLNKDFANVSEHIFRVMWISAIIAIEEKADLNKVLIMALVHDISESRVPEVHYLSRMYSKQDDESAITDTFSNTTLESEFTALAKEYEERQTLESKIVKDADNLDVDLELREQYANGNAIKLTDDFAPMRNCVYDKLTTQTAKEMWREIVISDPHDWHLNGKNRGNQGDWKAKT
jgi:5'-deoxynucleotidase YfbR-like HD superfamily hydrolase